MRARALPALGALLFLCLAGCAGPQTAPGPPPQRGQQLELRVLDSHDNPLAGARVTFKPLAGAPARPGPYRTDSQGVLSLTWRPQVIDETKGTQIRDRVYTYRSETGFEVSKPGYFPARGEIKAQDVGRRLVDPELKSMDRVAPLRPLKRVVVLREFQAVFGGELAKAGKGDPLAAKLLGFYEQIAPVARHLGAEFAWPAFVKEGGRLTLRFSWLGATWSGLALAPLQAQVAAGTGLPLAAAVGDVLLPAPGVQTVRLAVESQRSDPEDPHAAPQQVELVIEGPAQDFRELAAGKLSGDAFLERHPSQLRALEP